MEVRFLSDSIVSSTLSVLKPEGEVADLFQRSAGTGTYTCSEY